MTRVLLGWVLLLHALAHVSANVWTSAGDPIWFTTMLCTIAFVGYFGAGLALFRMPVARDHWKALSIAASLASLVFIIWTRPAWGMIGVVLDVVLFLLIVDVMQQRIDSAIAVFENGGLAAAEHPRLLKIGWTIGLVFLVYATIALLARPTMLHWGTTAAERAATLPGDDLLPADALYRIDHGITIRSSARNVWPWLVQIGQDRAGFYSYDWLERAVGDRVFKQATLQFLATRP